jgi:protocatechuate 3,4-dioxygenase beta subunit
MEKIITGRRSFLTNSLAAIAGATLMNKSSAAACPVLTPAQTSGPFYPGESKFGKDIDLTRIPGSSVRAKGEIIYVKGRVVDHLCRPVVNANVEIWQACASGRYNSAKDPNTAPLDPHFRYWAETFTNENGEYLFKTIVPGVYPADEKWDRPPHIHFRVAKKGYKELITQMYFKNHPLNDIDLILKDIPGEQRETVIVDFVDSLPGLEEGTKTGFFEIVLTPVRR